MSPSQDSLLDWFGLAASLLMFAGYEFRVWHLGRRQPERVARVAHARLRAQWAELLAMQPGSELLGVQTLRNALMSATIVASIWAVGLMGAVSLFSASPLLRDVHAGVTPRAVVVALLLSTLFASLGVSIIAIRFFNHASFMISIPVASALRTSLIPDTAEYLRRAGYCYSLSLRTFFVVAPLLVGLIAPALMPIPAAGMLVALAVFDRVPRPKA